MAEINNTRPMMKSDFKDNKLDKSRELNNNMTIKNSSQDEYTRIIKNIGGNN